MRLPFGFKGYVNVRSCTRFERTRHACGVIDTIFRNSVIFLRFFFIFIFIFITLCCSVRVSSFLSRRSSFYLFIYISFFTRKFKTTNNFFFFFSFNRSVTFVRRRLNSNKVFASVTDRKERNKFFL